MLLMNPKMCLILLKVDGIMVGTLGEGVMLVLEIMSQKTER